MDTPILLTYTPNGICTGIVVKKKLVVYYSVDMPPALAEPLA